MTVWYKQGVQGDLSRECQKALGRIATLFYPEDLFITATRDGNHMEGSFHYIGDAFDFRYSKKHYDIQEIKNAVGNGFDVVFEPDHIHVEYDPK